MINQLKGTATLPAPGRPVFCDWCNVKDKQAGLTLGTSCPAPTPQYLPEPCATPELDGGGTSSCECNPDDPNCVSPVLIDTRGDGLELTDAEEGVNFDIRNSGSALRLAWTLPNSDDAWLALDRNGNGTIDSGAELFGNFSPQPPSNEPNGFLALAVFDRPENGGNGDGRISSNDSVFFNLRLWQDTNHNGVSELTELHTLSELGLTALDLKYKDSKRTDQHGNWFRYRAKVESEHDATIERWAWDVFLQFKFESTLATPSFVWLQLRQHWVPAMARIFSNAYVSPVSYDYYPCDAIRATLFCLSVCAFCASLWQSLC